MVSIVYCPFCNSEILFESGVRIGEFILFDCWDCGYGFKMRYELDEKDKLRL